MERKGPRHNESGIRVYDDNDEVIYSVDDTGTVLIDKDKGIKDGLPINEIKARISAGEKKARIAREFGISIEKLNQILRKKK